MDLVKLVQSRQLKKQIPEFRPGDTVKVQVRVVEGDKQRIQSFQGVVLQRRGEGLNETFTVRKISSGIGVERIFQVHSPTITKLQVIKHGKARRAKLFYLRTRKGKSARVTEKRK